MTRRGSWKHEFDSKYNRLMNMGDMELMDRANTVVLRAIEGLDRISKYRKEIILASKHFKSLALAETKKA